MSWVAEWLGTLSLQEFAGKECFLCLRAMPFMATGHHSAACSEGDGKKCLAVHILFCTNLKLLSPTLLNAATFESEGYETEEDVRVLAGSNGESRLQVLLPSILSLPL